MAINDQTLEQSDSSCASSGLILYSPLSHREQLGVVTNMKYLSSWNLGISLSILLL